jgi:hypothetical protein
MSHRDITRTLYLRKEGRLKLWIIAIPRKSLVFEIVVYSLGFKITQKFYFLGNLMK